MVSYAFTALVILNCSKSISQVPRLESYVFGFTPLYPQHLTHYGDSIHKHRVTESPPPHMAPSCSSECWVFLSSPAHDTWENKDMPSFSPFHSGPCWKSKNAAGEMSFYICTRLCCLKDSRPTVWQAMERKRQQGLGKGSNGDGELFGLLLIMDQYGAAIDR